MSEIFALQRKTLNSELVNINEYIESTKDALCQVCLKVLLNNCYHLSLKKEVAHHLN